LIARTEPAAAWDEVAVGQGHEADGDAVPWPPAAAEPGADPGAVPDRAGEVEGWLSGTPKGDSTLYAMRCTGAGSA
jgi:hypothetical protein